MEREQRFKDVEGDFQRRVAAAGTPEGIRELKRTFGEERRVFREEAVEMGKRSPGLSIAMHQIMWARWVEVAVEHELQARRAFAAIVSRPESGAILREFRASLVAITASAHTIEAVFGDVKYLIPEQPRRDKRHKFLRHAFSAAFGVSGAEDEQLGQELSWLFTQRDSAAHPYTEPESPAQHPAGINTGAEHSHFNAVTSGRAVDIAMAVLKLAESPPRPHGQWIERWATERQPYHTNIEGLRRTATRSLFVCRQQKMRSGMRRRPVLVLVVIALMAPATPASAWANGPDGPDGYGTHDWILDKALESAGDDASWVRVNVALNATDDPDTKDGIDHASGTWWHVYDRWGDEWGGADEAAAVWFKRVEKRLAAGKERAASKALGYLAHIVGDVANPMHTDSSDKEDPIHSPYESDVDERIADYPFSYDGADTTKAGPAVRQLARHAHKKYWALVNTYDAHGYNTKVHRITKRQLKRAANALADLITSLG